MKRHPLTRPPSRSLKRSALRLLCALALVAHPTVIALGQQGGSYEIKQSVIASGGAASNGGGYQLNGTTGQSATGTSSGGIFTLAWGFWYEALLIPLLTTATASPAANAAGWHNQNPTITLTATGGTPPRSINYSATGAQQIAPTIVNSSLTSLDINQEGTTTLSYHAADAAGGVETTKTLIIKLDKVAPDVVINSPAATDYALNQQVAASYNCADARSGIESCVGTVPHQSLIDTSAVGTHNFTVTGTDIAGNQNVNTITYTVSSPAPPADKKITEADGETFDRFGSVVAMSGDTAIIGETTFFGFPFPFGNQQGSAYIIERNTGGANNWGQVKKLVAPDAVLGDSFGAAVAISGDLAVVGKPTAEGSQSGAAYVFGRNVGGANKWGLVKKLEVDKYYGSIVGISGDTVIVGRNIAEIVCNIEGVCTPVLDPEPWKLYVFRRNAGGANNWGGVKVIQDATESLGRAAINGDTIVASALAGTYLRPYKALIFERDAGGAENWGQVKTLASSDNIPFTFGDSVAIENDRIVVGASSYTQGLVEYEQGCVYVFERNAGGANNWGEVKKIVAPDTTPQDFFGFSVSISGGKIIVGASRADIGANTDQGAAYVFEQNTGGANNWGFVRKLIATSGGASEDFFGSSVGISGNTLIVGEPNDDIGGNTDQGSVYIFDSQ